MHIDIAHGLITGLVDPDEAVSTDWTRWRDRLDVVKVIEPDRSCWPALDRAGFKAHPLGRFARSLDYQPPWAAVRGPRATAGAAA
jgi:hypothetical protein